MCESWYINSLTMVAPIWKQCYIAGCTLFQHFATGVVLAFPAVLTPAITSKDSDIPTTRDEASWIAAMYSITGIASYIVMPAVLQIFRRKCVNFIVNLVTFIGSVIIAYAPSINYLIIGRLIQGFSYCGMYMCCIIIAEYVSPKRRGFFITIKISAFVLGILACHSAGALLTWRHIAWLAAAPSIIGTLGTLTWPESPNWLAYKERYDESAKSFEWLRGNDAESRKELRELITAQKELKKLRTNSNNNTLRGVISAFRKPEFLKPFLISSLLTVAFHCFGHHYLLAYIIEIMTEMTGDKSKGYYYTIAFDVMKIVSALASSGVVTLFKRRTVVFCSGCSACLALGLLCICYYLESQQLLSISWLTPIILIVHNTICYVGFIPVCIVIKGEIFPVQFKGVGTGAVGVINALSSIATVKFTATMLSLLKTHGTFAVYLFISAACLGCLYFNLPETKNRTLQDIEMEFFGLKLDVENETLDLQAKEMKPVYEKNLLKD